ncbi:MAG: hypothetical protein NVSMB51_13620 [Solirubrobacteraceae bacterium]
MSAFLTAASAAPPAGGAALGQIIGASAAATLLTVALLIFGLGHRSGRIRHLGRLAAFSERVSGMPGWVALPCAIATGGLLLAVFGLYYDISLHIDNGRDPGPLANPAHYFILAGLFGIFSAGWISIVLPTAPPGRAAVRLAGDWYAPVSGLLLLGCSSFAMIGFPLDDVWHRLFGQDVTLWGPTHLMMLTGAGMSLIGIHGLLSEGRAATRDGDGPRVRNRSAALLSGPRAAIVQRVLACGGLLAGLSIYQGEFDFGVPQFRLLFHPVLIALAAATALVAARLLAGRGGALAAAVFFLALRGVLSLLVGPLLGQTTPHFPIYLASAAGIEVLALALAPRRRPYAFALGAGVIAGSLGTLSEYGWSHVWMPIAWPAEILPQAILLSCAVGIAGGVIGAFLAGALMRRPEISGTRRSWALAGGSLAVIAAVIALLLGASTIHGRAVVTLGSVPGGGGVNATVRFVPASITHRADWILETAWQGHKGLVVAPLRRIADGVYTTTEPLPTSGSWKSVLRLHRGDGFASAPVYMPADSAIPVAGLPALTRSDRSLVADRTVLQRERKPGVSGWLWHTAGVIVLVLSLALMLLLGRGLVRLSDPPPRAPSSGTRGAARGDLVVAS